jgi:hypothetical protein
MKRTRTETKSAIPGQFPCPRPKIENNSYEAIAPRGVEALKIAMCLLQDDRESEVFSRAVVSAKAVGASFKCSISKRCRYEDHHIPL